MEEALRDPEHVIVPGRWVKCNKETPERPKCRGRFVAQECNPGGEAGASFYAATPPLEAKRVLLSQWAKKRTRSGQALKLHFLDVRKAYLNALPQRSLYIKLPSELGLGRGVV